MNNTLQTSLNPDNRAVSPVIGVILMVAITVILAAVIGAFVLGTADDLGNSAPQAQLDADTNTDGTITIRHIRGDTIRTDNLNVQYTGQTSGDTTEQVTTADGEFSAGDSYTTEEAAAPNSDYQVTHQTGNGDTSSSLGSYTTADTTTNSGTSGSGGSDTINAYTISNTGSGVEYRAYNTTGAVNNSNTLSSGTSPQDAVTLGDSIYAAATDGSGNPAVFQLNKDTGDVTNSYTVHSGTIQAIDTDGSSVYTGASDSTVKKTNPDTGNVEWSYTMGGAVTDLEVGPDGNIYAADNSGNVEKLSPDGTSTQTILANGPVTALTVGENGNVYVADTESMFGGTTVTISEFNSDTGSQDWSTTHSDPITALEYNSATSEVVAGDNTGTILRYGTDGTLKNSVTPDAANTNAPTDVADIKTDSSGSVFVSKAYDTYKLASDLTLDWRDTHNDGTLSPIALNE